MKVLGGEPSNHTGASVLLRTGSMEAKTAGRENEKEMGGKALRQPVLAQAGTLGGKEFGFCSVRRGVLGRGMACMI